MAAAMRTTEDHDAIETDGAAEVDKVAEPELLESDLLVEDVSIDGMCGVY